MRLRIQGGDVVDTGRPPTAVYLSARTELLVVVLAVKDAEVVRSADVVNLMVAGYGGLVFGR